MAGGGAEGGAVHPAISDWDDAYANAAHIPDGEGYPVRWARAAAAFRALVPPEVLAYGAHPRERVDLYRPDGVARGLVVFVHGGYWRAFDRMDWSHLAAGALARGWAVALPGYVLAPEARIAAIGSAVGRAIVVAAERIAGPVRLAGHSAGGQLVARQVAGDGQLGPDVAARVERVMSISGLHDLRPLMRTAMNSELRLDAAEAQAESPALLAPRDRVRLHAWVGAAERPEFRRQARLIATAWGGMAATALTEAAGRHHFDVIEGLEAAGDPLTEALCGDR